jgi:predicted XRE-type DNA-binding protein
MVDKRLRELMDIRLNVTRRGVAIAYEKKIDDHSGKVKEKRLHRVRWDALDDDRDYQQLAQMKKDHMENFNETAYFMSDDGEEERPDPEEAVQQYRNERIQQAYTGDFTQSDLAEIFDISRPRVSQILNESD